MRIFISTELLTYYLLLFVFSSLVHFEKFEVKTNKIRRAYDPTDSCSLRVERSVRSNACDADGGPIRSVLVNY